MKVSVGKVTAAAAAGLAVAARRRRGGAPQGDFFDWHGPADPAVDVGVTTFALPIRYWRTDCFMGLFPADHDAVRDLLPSPRLHPLRLPGGRAVVAVVAYNYLETGVGPYGEIGISPLCTLDRPAPAALALTKGYRQGFSGFVAHLPVTSRVAREAGRQVWGYPKFVADMDFVLTPEEQRVTLREGGQDVLELGVRTGGAAMLERAPLTTYTVHDDRLVRTVIPTRAHVATTLGASGGGLVLGDHPVGRSLAALDLGTTPLATRTYLTHSAILPAGEDVGPSARPYEGYAGQPRVFGRHTIRYDDGTLRVVTEASLADTAVAGA